MSKKIISAKYLPMNMPVTHSLVLPMVLDRLSAPGWAWGVMGCWLALLWVAFVTSLFICDPCHPKDV